MLMLPISTSEWPPKNLVAASTLKSTPCASGWKPSGLAQVLSIMVSTPWRRAAAAMAGTSAISMVTVPGASMQIMRVAGRISASMPAPIDGSYSSTSTPMCASHFSPKVLSAP